MCLDGSHADSTDLRQVSCGLQSLGGLSDRPSEVRLVDVSYNDITSIEGISEYSSLEVLTLDNNSLATLEGFPKLESLKTLWLNKNDVQDIEALVDCLESSAPKLQYLSLLGNPGCKSELSGASKGEAERQRLFIIWRLPSLQFLNASPVTPAEREEAMKRGKFLRTTPVQVIDKTAPVKAQTHTLLEQESRKQQPTFGKQRRFYTGKFSEGNRFICDDAL
eukprot:TRINITY_DN44618_c0_g1_i1.p1 TRINITY_DN44618_c0_g1~~TRINITY_DN44618_c0_g1_i1.p1  ORF type:complete len:221 (+),score=84.72 TRINITY_DN44618_c0_g1_i1:271-933(+)